MNDIAVWHNEALGQQAVKALTRNRFTATYCADGKSAVAHVLGLVPQGSQVGFGGSMTERALDLVGACKAHGCGILDHNAAGLSPEERGEIRRKQLASDVFICSANAVTLNGELMNVDGSGNRVAALSYGPGRVIIVAGVNKIVKDLDEADKRIRMIAAPMNNKRIGLPNPCTSTGVCMDCRSATRICNITTILRHCPGAADIHVVLVGESLGY